MPPRPSLETVFGRLWRLRRPAIHKLFWGVSAGPDPGPLGGRAPQTPPRYGFYCDSAAVGKIGDIFDVLDILDVFGHF